MAKQQKIEIKLPKGYSSDEARAIGLDIVRRIVDRTQNENVDKDGKSFPGYSDAYQKSLAFKIAGKSKHHVDLTLSGDLLAALDVLSASKGKVTIGIPRGDSENNGKAEGNILGTYGSKKPSRKKARNFLGLTKAELADILANHETEQEALTVTLDEEG
jgi:hypothetical protein